MVSSGSLFFEHRKFTWPSTMQWKIEGVGFLKDFRKPGKVWMALKKYKHLKMNNRLFLFYFLCTVKFATRCYTYEHGNKPSMLEVE